MFLRRMLMVCVLVAVVILPLVGCNDTKPKGSGGGTGGGTGGGSSNTTATK